MHEEKQCMQSGLGWEVRMVSEFPPWSWREAGAPQSVHTSIADRGGDNLEIHTTLVLKTATRLPEVSCRQIYMQSGSRACLLIPGHPTLPAYHKFEIFCTQL